MAQVFIASPFFVKAARAGFEAVPERLEAAARTLGASQWHAFWTVTVPLARRSLLAGAVLCWARALSEFGATMMFAGNYPGRTQTLAPRHVGDGKRPRHGANDLDLSRSGSARSYSRRLGGARFLMMMRPPMEGPTPEPT
jgi:hypothetical protein